MHSAVLVVSMLFGAAICAPAPSHLRIFRSFNDSQISVPAVLDALIGEDLTLTCGTFDAKNRPLAEQVCWRRKRRRPKLPPLGNSNTLSFTPVTMEDQGTYLCFNYNRQLLAKVYVRVKLPMFYDVIVPEKTHFSRRKRDDDYWNKFEIPKFSPDQFQLPEIPKIDFGELDRYHQGLLDEVNEENDRKRASKRSIKPQVLYMLLGVVALFSGVYVLMKCCHMNRTWCSRIDRASSSHQPGYQQMIDQIPNISIVHHDRCFDRGNYFLEQFVRNEPDATSHTVSTVAPSEEPAQAEQSPEEQVEQARQLENYEGLLLEAFLLTVMRAALEEETAEAQANQGHADLPPTYADSVANSTTTSMHNVQGADHTLPPSYEEATRASAGQTVPENNCSGDTHGGCSGGGCD